jgi:ADP-ribosylation factor-binding protein GGA
MAPFLNALLMLMPPQGYSLKLVPQSGRQLNPREQGGVTQVIYLNGVEQGKGDSVKLRWKASYKVGAQPINEQGEISSLGIA